jgi:hypothetical protein
MACVPQLLAAQVISIDFNTGDPGGPGGAGPFVLQAGDVAGVVPAANWNQAASANGNTMNLRTNTGAATTAQVAVTGSTNPWSLGGTPDTPNGLMMRGYLDTGNDTTTTVEVTGLPAAFTTPLGYRVIVYFDGDNGGGQTRGGRYTIGTQTRIGVDRENVQFTGTFTQVVNNGDAGNYMIFTGLTAPSFILAATPDMATSTTGTLRAPINAIQIEAVVPEPVSIALAGLGMAGLAGCGLRRKRKQQAEQAI